MDELNTLFKWYLYPAPDRKLTNEQIYYLCKEYMNGVDSYTLARKYNIGPTIAREYLGKCGIPRRQQSFYARKYLIDDYYFDQIDSPDKAYWLGFIYADGCILKSQKSLGLRIDIAKADVELLHKLKISLKSTHPIYDHRVYTTYSKNGSDIVSLHIVNKTIASGLHKHGLYMKSTRDSIPSMASKFFNHFVRGYFDGDGCICISSREVYKVYKVYGTASFCGNVKFLSELKNILSQFAGVQSKNKIYPCSNTTKISQLSYGGQADVQRIAKFMYEGSSDLYLKRKKDKFDKVFSKGEIWV